MSHDRTIKLWHSNGDLIRSIVADPVGLNAVVISQIKPLTYGCNWIADYMAHNSDFDRQKICSSLKEK